MEKETYYCITRFEKIKKENITAHIKGCATLEDAINFPEATFSIIKKRLPGENTPGTGLVYPNVFSYKITDKEGNPFFITYGKGKCDDYTIKTGRFAYFDSPGSGSISFTDRNGEADTVELSAGFDNGIGIIESIIEFLIDFNDSYSADWKMYRLKVEQIALVDNLNKQLAERNVKIKTLSKKLRDYRKQQK